jgi:hypothetical protein
MIDLKVLIRGGDVKTSRGMIIEMADFDDGRPKYLLIDDDKESRADVENWRAELTHAHEGLAAWDSHGYLAAAPFLRIWVGPTRTEFEIPRKFAKPDDAIAIVDPLPFERCWFDVPISFWRAWRDAGHPMYSSGVGGRDFGWGCGFRGAGYERLYSRRWLDFGPWRVIRRPNDTTYLQFYDLAITDPKLAWQQAAPALQRMGGASIHNPIGGYIDDTRWTTSPIRGFYNPTTRAFEITVPPNGSVSLNDMRLACQLRLDHRLPPERRTGMWEQKQPPPTGDRIDTIAYFFFDRARAEAHVHELWLRELECWYVGDDGAQHRLDTDYHPTPNPPDWVHALEARGS